VRLTVEFNPRAVAAYRCIGYDPSASNWQDAPIPLELRPGESATALLEVRLLDDAADRVATVELRWQDRDGRSRLRRQPVSRLQFASSFQQSAPSLQAALLAAEAGQLLTRSPFVQNRRQGWNRLLSQADELGPVARWPEVESLLELASSVKLLPERRQWEER
jgi:hypothetical protein